MCEVSATDLHPRLATVRSRWPQGPEPDATFDALVAARPAAQQHVEDMYLAWWCSSGEAVAIAAFEAMFDDDLRGIAARFKDLSADELRQHLRIKLFVGTSKSPPKIRDYTGSGSLKSWLRVTAVRSFVDLLRSTRAHRYEQEINEADLLGLATRGDPVLRSELVNAVKSAFATAIANLASRQRVFLRHAYVDHHTLDQIASLYAVHRTTVARTLASAREQLIADTRAAVASALRVDGDELTSVIRMLDSRIDLSLSRVLVV